MHIAIRPTQGWTESLGFFGFAVKPGGAQYEEAYRFDEPASLRNTRLFCRIYGSLRFPSVMEVSATRLAEFG
jgi:hypothetical protein